MSINTKEQLKDYIHSIHDYIRNSGAGYGMNALKIFNVFYTMKLLENKMAEIGFNEELDWRYVKKYINNSNFEDDVRDWIYDTINKLRSICLNDNTKTHPLTKDIKNILDIVLDCKEKNGNKNKELQHIEDEINKVLKKQNDDVQNNIKLKELAYFIYFQLPERLDKKFIKDMFIKIDSLENILKNNKDFDIKGKIYEYFIGRDKTAMSDLGAYFTDRHLTNFIMEEINPILDKNGNVQTMIDPFAGSGGMTLSYVSYINKNYKVNWKKNDNYKNVYHYDMSEDVVKIAGIEYYSLTGKFPSYENQFTRINSFKEDRFNKYKYLITNPPYGGDKSTKSADTINRECIIEYNKKEINTLIEKIDITPIKYKNIELSIIKDIKATINKDKDICEFINFKESILINDKIEQFNDYAKKLFINYNFDENKEEILKVSRLCIQNILYQNIINKNNKEQEKMQVNYYTCGSKIKEYSKKIVKDYHNIQKNLITNTIDNELLKLNKDVEPLKYKQFESYKIQLSKNPTDKIIMDELEKFTDKESCSLILLMSLLDNDGVCAGVLKEGVFFDTNYSKLRGYLINNFNVSKVISVSADQFENTTTKTSIIIFKNDGKKTEKIEFYDLDIEKYSDDKIIFGDKSDFIQGLINGNVNIEPKNKISNVNKKLISTATFDELSKVIIKYNKNNELQFDIPFSFNSKDYIKKEIVCGDGYELVKLGDICESKNGYAFKTSEYKDNGVPLITITHIKNERLNFNNNHYIENNDIYKNYEIQKNDLIISLTGKKPNLVNIALNTYSDKLYLNQRCAILRNFKKINYYYFLAIFNGFLQNHIDKYIGNGTNQENVSLIEIQQLKIPIPKSQAKIQEWVDKISKPYDKMNSNKSKINELEEKVKNRIKEICENEDCDEVEFDSLLSYLPKKNKYRATDGFTSGLYKFYTSSQDRILYRNDYEFENTCILIGRGGNPSIHLASKFSVSHDDVYVINIKDVKNKKLIQFIFNYLKININLISSSFKGSTIKHSSKEGLSSIKIQIPKNKKLIQNLEPTFQKIETLQTEMKEAETLYKQLIKELSEEALPSNKNVSTITTNNNESDDISEEDIKHNIVSINNIDYIEENGNYYSIDSKGQKDYLCYTTNDNGKIKKYKHKNIIIKEPLEMMLAPTSGRMKKSLEK